MDHQMNYSNMIPNHYQNESDMLYHPQYVFQPLDQQLDQGPHVSNNSYRNPAQTSTEWFGQIHVGHYEASRLLVDNAPPNFTDSFPIRSQQQQQEERQRITLLENYQQQNQAFQHQLQQSMNQDTM